MIDFPKIMGILNVTPDSFSDGGKYFDSKSATDKALKMIDEGADIIDIGGESTKPGAENVDTSTEIERVIPVIKQIKKTAPDVKISIDTTKYDVALNALDFGADMLNDVSNMRNEPRLADLAAQYNVPLIIMHSRSNPKNMQINPEYSNLWDDLISELSITIESAKNRNAKNIIIDPGIGFAKNYEHNIEILKNLQNLYKLNCPILLGISRKSFIGKMLNISSPENRDFPTAILHSLLLKFKIEYIRVHNVELVSQIKKIYETFS
jgi:dihydropteroate synthase